MNKIIKFFIAPVLFIALFSSCGTVTTVNRNSTFAPDVVQLRINIADLQYLGETEISVTYTQYLGFISVLNEVNGEAYQPWTDMKETKIDGVNGGLIDGFKLGKRIDKAAHKVVEKFPNATYFKVVYNKKATNRLFLGKEVKQTVLVKAYSFK